MKKLFSYLLISSMVVLSSCTNYDDQFDDLNSQINSLKSQIEGFSSLSSGLTALQGTVSSLQSAVAALPKTATPATDISGLEASVAALQASLASASTSAEVSAISTELAAAQAALATAIAANGTTGATNATDIAALKTALDAVSATLATMQTALAGAATTTEITALQAELDLVQADLAELLAANNIYTGDIVINSAATLTAAEQLGKKVGIVNGNVHVTQDATNGIDATKLQTLVSKINTVTGAVSYTHSGTGVVAVNFTALTSAGSVSLVQDAPISLPVLASTGVAVLKHKTDVTKVTSVSAPVLTSVTSFDNGAPNTVGNTSAMSVDLGSLVRYTSTLTVKVKTTGDTTVDLASLTTTSATTGLQSPLTFVLTGGDDLTLPLFVSGSVDAQNVKSLTLPKFIIDAALDLKTGSSRLESLAIHEVRANLSFVGYNNLTTLDVIGTVDTSVVNQDILGQVTISGNTTDLTTASFAGKLLKVDIAGATDLSSITTSGMIRNFSLTGSADITTLTLGHAGITGMTGSKAAVLNDTNAGVLVIDQNPNLVSFSATNIATLGRLHITSNESLTSFDLKSTLALGTAEGAATKELVDVLITDNALSGSVQRASGQNISPVVKGKITQASLSNIATYLKAVEAAISTPAALVPGTLLDAAGWDRTEGQYKGDKTSGDATAAFTLTNADVEIDSLTAELDAAGTDAGASSDYKVIEVFKKGKSITPSDEAQAKITLTAAYGIATTINANGGSKEFTVNSGSTSAADLAAIGSDPIWSTYGVTALATAGANKRTNVTIAGTYSDTDAITLQWAGASGTNSFTTTVTSNSSSTDEIATAIAANFNAYSLTNSDTTTAATASATLSVVTIMTGSYSPTTQDLYITPTAGDYFPGIVGTISTSLAVNPTAVVPVVAQASGYLVTISAKVSTTATLASGLGVSVSGTGAAMVAATGDAHPIVGTAKQNATGYNADRVYVAAVGATNADITKRAAWL